MMMTIMMMPYTQSCDSITVYACDASLNQLSSVLCTAGLNGAGWKIILLFAGWVGVSGQDRI